MSITNYIQERIRDLNKIKMLSGHKSFTADSGIAELQAVLSKIEELEPPRDK